MKPPYLILSLLVACGGSSQAAPATTMDTAQTVHPAPSAPTAATHGMPGVPSLSVAPGSTPDPQLMQGVAQGESPSPDPDCFGFFTSTPSFTVLASAPMAALRIVVNAGVADTTLRVQGPDGVNHCNDDFEQLNPAVTVPSASGMYQVWVGTYSQADSVVYAAGVSANPTLTPLGIQPAPGSDTGPDRSPPPDMGTQSSAGTITLRPGFRPEPHTVAGPTIPAGTELRDTSGWHPGCVGLASPIPDHLLVLQQDFSHLTIVAKSSQDITLIVQHPDGSYSCNDDLEDLNPGVGRSMPRGTYKIWVGLYSSGSRATYTLGLSESDGFLPSMVGGGGTPSTPNTNTTPSPFSDVTPN